MDDAGERPGHSAPERAHKHDAAKIAKMYRKKARRLERELYAELGKNVDLYNRKNRAVAVLKRLTQENRDLLDVLRESLGEPSLPHAERAALSPEEHELFHLETM